ncbi:DivIVA domain-containing protein [Nocardioides sp.]|uniref:DivIVA domain-containing protein n=1 Tax=Nocardioides sp. TaxID=35761 RepID=UPI003D10F132
MSQPEHQFRVVMRGYDPADVDRKVAELEARIATAEQGANDLRSRLQSAESQAGSASSQPASFEHLGARVGQILSLAEAEATELRDQVRAEVETHRKESEQASLVIRDEADQYADQRRRDADAEATRIVTDAKRAADGERDAAERDAAARRQEAEAIFEQQRANAAKAASDFETTLAERRDRTTAEFQEQQAATQAQLDAMAARVDEVKATAERQQAAAEAEARRIVEEAEGRAAALVREARATADRVRADSDRELAAASQRRDSINAQLSNVRQMLQTLSGSATGFAVDPLPEVPEASSEDQVDEAGEPQS